MTANQPAPLFRGQRFSTPGLGEIEIAGIDQFGIWWSDVEPSLHFYESDH